jgi:hypothetical protein
LTPLTTDSKMYKPTIGYTEFEIWPILFDLAIQLTYILTLN